MSHAERVRVKEREVLDRAMIAWRADDPHSEEAALKVMFGECAELHRLHDSTCPACCGDGTDHGATVQVLYEANGMRVTSKPPKCPNPVCENGRIAQPARSVRG